MKIKSFLSKILRLRVLPSLPKEYDRNYVVDSVNWALLERFGYTILHRPYFAMRGSTHEKWTLNPHTQIGIDAAKDEETAISFKEYLKLFDEYTERQKGENI